MKDSIERDLAIANELGHMADARIKELESQFTNFRTRVINLCKEKAAEWERRSKAHDYFTNAELSDYRSKRQAANELREAIENLDHQGD